MRWLVTPLMAVSITSCAPAPEQRVQSDVVLFEGARLIPGDGSGPIESAALLVEGGRIAEVGQLGEVNAPEAARRIDLSGKTIMPFITTLHTHVGYNRGASFSEEHYGRETIEAQLDVFLYYGVGAVLSLGVDRGDVAFELRSESETGRGALLRTAGRGLAAPDAGPQFPALRSAPLFVETPENARDAVRELVAKPVDMIKIWVDDRNDSVAKLPPQIFRAIIEEAHAHGAQVVAHVYELGDAKALAAAGVDGFAHLVRDEEVDDELVELVLANDVFIISNLNVQGHPEKDAALDDPALHETVPAESVAELRAQRAGRGAPSERALAIYRNMERSLAKLAAAGARIAFGGDSGIPGNFVGFSEHRELQLMVEAGMQPLDAIRAATSTTASILGLDDRGSLAPGKRADFMVLEGNPLEDITHTRRITAVYRAGEEVDREALRQR